MAVAGRCLQLGQQVEDVLPPSISMVPHRFLQSAIDLFGYTIHPGCDSNANWHGSLAARVKRAIAWYPVAPHTVD